MLGQADPLDSGHAGDGEEPRGQVLVDGRLDPSRGRRRGDHEVGAYLVVDEIEHGGLEAPRQRARHDHQAEAEGEDAAGEGELWRDVGEPLDGEPPAPAKRPQHDGAQQPRLTHEEHDEEEVCGERSEVAAPGRIEADLGHEADGRQDECGGEGARRG